MNLSTVKWAQWDKAQSRELLGLFMCAHCTVHNCCAQYCTEQTWQFFLLPSRQSPLLRWRLFEQPWKCNIAVVTSSSAIAERTRNTSYFDSQNCKWNFWATLLGGIRGNIDASSVHRWKKRVWLPIGDNWTFYLALTAEELQSGVFEPPFGGLMGKAGALYPIGKRVIDFL